MKKLIYFIAIAFALTSCQEIIELDLDDPEPELVIEGYISGLDFYIPDGDLVCSEDVIFPKDSLELFAAFAGLFDIDSIAAAADYFPYNKVQLSLIAPYFDNQRTPRVSNALVQLYEDGNLVETLIEDQSELGSYRITHTPVVNAAYHVVVEVEIGGELQTYETDPEPYLTVAPILFTDAVYIEDAPFQDSAGYFLNINTYEVPNPGDHYRWEFYINNEYQGDPGDISVASDDGIDGACVVEFDVYGDFLDLGDTIAIFQSRISQKHYDFMTNIQAQTAFVGGPFDTPPAPIRGNVKNVTKGTDAYGYFVSAAVTVGLVVVPDTIPVP